MKKNIILGAGLTGLSTAYFLKKNYIIFEKENNPGGLCRSEKKDGFTFDYTGHLLHFKKENIKKMVLDMLKGNFYQHERDSYIYMFNRYIKYPFQLHLYALPPKIINECVKGLEKVETKISFPSNFHQWLNYNFGDGITKYFMIPYNKKIWTVHPENLIFDWTRGSIPRITLKNMLSSAKKQVYCGKIGYNSTFWYPKKGGINALISAFLSRISNLNLNKKATYINFENKEVLFKDGEKIKYDSLISTIPLPELIAIISDIPQKVKDCANFLEHTSVYNINLGIKGKIDTKHWIYFPEKEYSFYRIGFNSNFSPYVVPNNTTGIYIEIAYSNKVKINKKKIINKVISQLIKCGIISNKKDILTKCILDIKYANVIYNHKYNESTKTIHRFLKRNNIYSIGRFGGWQYLSMENCILEGRETVKYLTTK